MISSYLPRTVRDSLSAHVPERLKRKLRSLELGLQKTVAERFFAFSYEDLVQALEDLGIAAGDSLMVHSSINPSSGFKGRPHDIIRALRQAIDPSRGTLLMVSLPYTGSTYEYLRETNVFDVKRTYSKMGLLTEIFRRQKNVIRSLHPTHPVLACGAKAAWFAEGHEQCPCGCGPGSPFERLFESKGKVLFYDVAFPFAFLNYIEHLIQDRLPFPLYAEETFSVDVVKATGEVINTKARAFSPEVVRRRHPELLEKRLRDTGRMRENRVGRTHLKLIDVEDAVACALEMAPRFFYETA